MAPCTFVRSSWRPLRQSRFDNFNARPACRWTPFGPERRLQVACIVGNNFAGLVFAGTRVYARARVGRRKTPGTLFYVILPAERRDFAIFPTLAPPQRRFMAFAC